MKNRFVLSSYMNINTTKVGAFQITTPASGKPITLSLARFSSDKDNVNLSLLEDYSFTHASSVALTPVSTYRGLSASCSAAVKVYSDVTASAGAAALTLESAFPVAATDNMSLKNEWVLKPNTKYLLSISNQNAGTAKIGYTIVLEE